MPECLCATCRRACTLNPGWFLPEEARAAIRDGKAAQLMRDWLEPSTAVGNDERIYVLAPASVGREGRDAPEITFADIMSSVPWNKGRCTFLTQDCLCAIHASGYKPFQCSHSLVCVNMSSRGEVHVDDPDSNYTIARAWNTPLGRKVVREWTRAVKQRRA